MNAVDSNVRVTVLGILAFGFLGFYVWFAVQGTRLLTTCRLEPNPVAEAVVAAVQNDPKHPSKENCKTMGGRLQNVLDLFTPISGVVTAVALAALGYKPEAPGKVTQRIRGYRALDGTGMSYLDLMIVIYLLVWTVVGMVVCFKTAALPLADASRWNVEWLRNFGRTWWPSALTAVAFWLGAPAPKSKQQNPAPMDDKQAA